MANKTITQSTKFRKAYYNALDKNNKPLIEKLNRKDGETSVSYNIRISNYLRSKKDKKFIRSRW